LRSALERVLEGCCDTCGERTRDNPLRVFDCKNEACRALAARLPVLRQHLCADCETHHATVMNALGKLGIPHRENPHVVRGLDYYTRTAFEVHYPALGAQSALGGGGRYDGLVEACGGPATPAVGFSAGIERVLYALDQTRPERLARALPATALVLPLGDATRVEALQLARELRAYAQTVVDLSGRSLKAQLRGADRSGARVAVILGSDEVARGEVVVRDLRASEQDRVARAQVGDAVAALLHEGEA
jgi:histidyl-tRNA synthetase